MCPSRYTGVGRSGETRTLRALAEMVVRSFILGPWRDSVPSGTRWAAQRSVPGLRGDRGGGGCEWPRGGGARLGQPWSSPGRPWERAGGQDAHLAWFCRVVTTEK